MSATPEQIAEAEERAKALLPAIMTLMEYGIPADVQELLVCGSPHLGIRAGALQAAITSAQAERVRVLEALLQRLEPSIGWRSAMGTSRDFMCEFCHQTHEHFAHIKHTDDCPVIQVRAALRGDP